LQCCGSHRLDADLDPDFLFDADPDPTFYPDPDPNFLPDLDPEPSFQIKAQILEKDAQRGSYSIHFLACHLQIDADPDPDPAYPFDVDPDPGSQNDADPDPDPQHWSLSTYSYESYHLKSCAENAVIHFSTAIT
jgi:hypothetical protein